MATKKPINIFISAVSDEFRRYRLLLDARLKLPGQRILLQESLPPAGLPTLEKLSHLIQSSDLVIHLVGTAAGEAAHEISLAAIKKKYPDIVGLLPNGGINLTYTQWEAWLAHYWCRPLLIAQATESARREISFVSHSGEQELQVAHLESLKRAHHYVEVYFSDDDELVNKIRASIKTFLPGVILEFDQYNNLPGVDLGALFVGRDLDERRLSSYFSGGIVGDLARVFVVYGPPGIGKTRFALEYARKNQSEYCALLFVMASDTSSLNRNLAGLSCVLPLNLSDEIVKDEDKQREAVLSWLRGNPGWLLIIDGIQDEPTADEAQELAHGLRGGHVLITSRIADWGAAVGVHELNVLDSEKATYFLLERTFGKRSIDSEEYADAAKLAHTLGCYPLMLELAAAYISMMRIGFKSYLQRWNESSDESLKWNNKRLTYYPSSFHSAWLANFERLGPETKKLLQCLSWFSSDAIPVDVIPAGRVDAQSNQFSEQLSELAGFSLIKIYGDQGKIIIHSLIQEMSLNEQNNKEKSCSLSMAWRWLNVSIPAASDKVENWAVMKSLISHGKKIAQLASGDVLEDVNGRLPMQLAMYLEEQGFYVDADFFYRISLGMEKKFYGDDSPALCVIYGNYGNFLRVLGKYKEAEVFLRKAVDISSHQDIFRESLGVFLNNLSIVLSRLGCYSEASEFSRRALEFDEKMFGNSHEKIIYRLANMAQRLQDESALDEAETLTRKALDMAKKIDIKHPDVAFVSSNLAVILYDKGDYKGAEALLDQSLEIDEMFFGAEHPNTAVRLGNLAHVYAKTNRFGLAEEFMQKALNIEEKYFGKDSVVVANRLASFSALLYGKGEVSAAKEMMEKALGICRMCLGDDHHKTQEMIEDFSYILKKGADMSVEDLLVRKVNGLRNGILNPSNAPEGMSISQMISMGAVNMKLDALVNDLKEGRQTEKDLEYALERVVEIEIEAKKIIAG